jgi:hypothetical protein
VMNSKFLKAVAFRSFILWPAMYVAISNTYGLGIYAERLLSFFGVMLLLVGSLIIIGHEKEAARDGAKDRYNKPFAHRAFAITSIIIETCIFIALGWHWVASGFILVAIGSAMVRAEIEKLEADK